MGSPVRLTVVGPVETVDRVAGPAWDAASLEFDATDLALSGFRPDSAVSRLNETAGRGGFVAVEERLYRALAAGHRAWRVTGHRFDPRVLVDLERLGDPVITGSGHEAAARPGTNVADGPQFQGSGWPWLERRPRERAVAIAERVDLGGIGKGLALRWAWRAVESRVPIGAGALLEAGGDLIVGGPSPDGGAWRISIEDPAGGDAPVAVIEIACGAVCTSSVRLRRWTTPDGRPAHHLIDPLTHAPGGSGLASVTVAAPDPAWAEIWSKALFLCGPAAIGVTARRAALAAWWVADTGGLEMTPAARLLTRWP